MTYKYLQVGATCSPLAHSCYLEVAKETFPCNVSCIGLYANVQYISYVQDCERKPLRDDYEKQLCAIQEEYFKYKNSFAKNIVLMYEEDTWDMLELTLINQDNMYLKNYPNLQFFEIYFDTATYDKIERDVKVNFD